MSFLNKIFGRAADALALMGLVVSLVALYVSYDSARTTNRIASQALETSRQANEIALGIRREPAILQFSDGSDKKYQFDFTSVESIGRDLKQSVQLENDGQKNIEGARFEIIGVEPLTYPLSDPAKEIRPLPSLDMTINFNSVIQPGGFVNIDFRKPILQYLSKLQAQILNKQDIYVTSFNVVVTPKAQGESAFAGAPSKASPRDRELMTVKFKSEVITSDAAKKVLEDEAITNRVFSPQ